MQCGTTSKAPQKPILLPYTQSLWPCHERRLDCSWQICFGCDSTPGYPLEAYGGLVWLSVSIGSEPGNWYIVMGSPFPCMQAWCLSFSSLLGHHPLSMCPWQESHQLWSCIVQVSKCSRHYQQGPSENTWFIEILPNSLFSLAVTWAHTLLLPMLIVQSSQTLLTCIRVCKYGTVHVNRPICPHLCLSVEECSNHFFDLPLIN